MSDGQGVLCQPGRCSADEICTSASLYYMCRPVHRTSCQVLGGRHYITFDSRLYHFQGSCTYVLSQMCAPSPNHSLEYYRVVVEILMPETGLKAPRTELLRMTVYGQDIAIIPSTTGHVNVSGFNPESQIKLLA